MVLKLESNISVQTLIVASALKLQMNSFYHCNISATYKADYRKKVTDHTGPDIGPLSPSITTPLPPMELSLPEQQELGYMPLRDDFERVRMG